MDNQLNSLEAFSVIIGSDHCIRFDRQKLPENVNKCINNIKLNLLTFSEITLKLLKPYRKPNFR